MTERASPSKPKAPPSLSLSKGRSSRPYSLETLAVAQGILESPASAHSLVQRLRHTLLHRGLGLGSGFCEFQHRLRVLDRDGTQLVGYRELRALFDKLSLGFSEGEVETFFRLFSHRTGGVDIGEVVLVVRGLPSAQRREAIDRAFSLLDLHGEGALSLDLLVDRFDPLAHPLQRSPPLSPLSPLPPSSSLPSLPLLPPLPSLSPADLFRTFLRDFSAGGEGEGRVGRGEWREYYYCASAASPSDLYFASLLEGCWRLRGEGERPRGGLSPRLEREGQEGGEEEERGRRREGSRERGRREGSSRERTREGGRSYMRGEEKEGREEGRDSVLDFSPRSSPRVSPRRRYLQGAGEEMERERERGERGRDREREREEELAEREERGESLYGYALSHYPRRNNNIYTLPDYGYARYPRMNTSVPRNSNNFYRQYEEAEERREAERRPYF